AKTEKPPKDAALKEYYRYFNEVAGIILKMAAYGDELHSKDYFAATPFEQLHEENKALFADLLPENYPNSYSDPANCVKAFGDGPGQLLSYFYLEFRMYSQYARLGKLFKMEEYNRVFIEAFDQVRQHGPDLEALKRIITAAERKDKTADLALNITEGYSPDFTFYTDLVRKADLSDSRYLFRYGRYISDNELKTAAFFRGYPETKLKKLSKLIARAYVNGFAAAGKDLSKKSTVSLSFCIGQEKLIRYLVKELKKHKLNALLSAPQTSKVNEQYGYDHRFDTALFLDKDYTGLVEQSYDQAAGQCIDLMKALSGMILLTKFGEPPFKPQNKPECLRFSDAQQQLYQGHLAGLSKIQEKYAPRKELSFTIISFPAPEIGRDFERIFEDILEVNMLDPRKYEAVQQLIIDALDRADHVHVKGAGANRTDLKVKLQPLADPAKQSNFENCGANVNIPVGEVFTSPRLAGTDGRLHVGEAFLGGLKYVDLTLDFSDGYVTGYSCGNFGTAEENRKYIEENLLFPHKTLPMGEFAIGTNTLAYVAARKHGILDVLPVLIIEKMGPHFAIGDTCYSREEDLPVFNPDKKEVIARENEKSALRKTDMPQAYTHKHTDITLPYEEIAFIAAVTPKGEKIDIIKNGRFILPGTRKLNKPFKQLENE
ncbi:MAG: aminopeptidase, partial [Candidatus Edwardsbacteria bacterium]|nr:aminopeptidase [Candidatus Edwardsbacteria bacterium]